MNINSLPMETIAVPGQNHPQFALSSDSLSLYRDLELSPRSTVIVSGETNGDFSRLLARLPRLAPPPTSEGSPDGSDGDTDDDDGPVETALISKSLPDYKKYVVHSSDQDSVYLQNDLPETACLANKRNSLNDLQVTATPLKISYQTQREIADGVLKNMPLITDTERLSFNEDPSAREAARITRQLSENPARPGDSPGELAITSAAKQTSATPVPSASADCSSNNIDISIQYDRIAPGQPVVATGCREWPGYFLAGNGHHVRAVADLPELGKMVVQLSRDDSGVSVNVASRGDTWQILSADTRTLLQLVADSLHPTTGWTSGQNSPPVSQENITTTRDTAARETIDLSFTARDDGNQSNGGTAGNQESAQCPPTQSLARDPDQPAGIGSPGQFLPFQPRGTRAALVDFRV